MTDKEALVQFEKRCIHCHNGYEDTLNLGEPPCDCCSWALAISALRDRIAGGWISVEERLPETDIDVLVRYIGINSNMVFHQVLHYYACDETPHFQHMLNEKNLKVTHWRPLPAPPSEEGK